MDSKDKKEIKADDGKPKDCHVPEPPQNKQGENLAAIRLDAAKLDAEAQAKKLKQDYSPEEVKAGKEAREAKPEMDKAEKKASKAPRISARTWFRMTYNEKKRHALSQLRPDADKPRSAIETALQALDQIQAKQKAKSGEPEKKAEAGPSPKALFTDKPIKLSQVKDAGADKFKVTPAAGQKIRQVDVKYKKTDLGGHPGSFMAPGEGMGKEELDKAGTGGAQKPGGAGMPKQNKMPAAPAKPVGPSKNPQAAQNRQAQGAMKQSIASGMGKQTAPAAGSVNKPIPKAPHMVSTKPKMAMKSEAADLSVKKAEEYSVSEAELGEQCEHCGTPQFINSSTGLLFKPCACFMALTKDEEGNPINFVALRKTQGGYKLSFSPNADEEAKRTFLLMLKSRLLIRKRFGV